MLKRPSVEQLKREYQSLLDKAHCTYQLDDHLHIIDRISQNSKLRLSSEYILKSTSANVNKLFNGGLLSNQLNIYDTKDVCLSEHIVSSFIANSLIIHPLSDVIYITIKTFYPKLVISQLPKECDYKDTLSRLRILPIYGIKDFISSINYAKSLDHKISLVVINGLNIILDGTLSEEFTNTVMQSLRILPFHLVCCMLAINYK